MQTIYLVRHGQSESNIGGPAQPNADIKLTALGHIQAGEVADWLQKTLDGSIDSISVSKFLRTQQTAQPLVKIAAKPFTIVDMLHEFDYMSFVETEGKCLQTRTDMANNFWLQYAPSAAHGIDSESYEQFVTRVAAGLAYFKTLPSGNHVVFTHGLWISMLIWQILGQSSNSNLQMRRFRQFELAIRAKNGEVFCLKLPKNAPPAITKVRECFHKVEQIEYR